MDFSKLQYVIKGIGFRGILRTLLNTIYRDYTEKRYRSQPISTERIYPGYGLQTDILSNGILRKFSKASLEIILLENNLTRITWQPGKITYPYTIVDKDWRSRAVHFEQNKEYTEVRSGETIIQLSNKGEILFKKSDREVFRKDNPPYRVGEAWNLVTDLKPEEHIYGMGERAAPINLRPGDYRSWNIDVGGTYTTGKDPLYLGSPVYLSVSSSCCYLVYFENSYKSNYSIHDDITATFHGGALRYYVITGTLEEIYTQFSNLVGFPYFPPKWALGYHQSRWGYRTENEVIEVINGFEAHDLPLSAIHLDIDYMDDYRVFTIKPGRFPNIKKLARQWDAEGIKLVGSLNPAVKKDPNFKLYAEGKSNNYFCKLPGGRDVKGVSWPGWSVFPDFSNKETRNWWATQYKYLVDSGISGFWHDMNEPASFTAWGGLSLPQSTQHLNEGSTSDHGEIHNLYGLLMNKSAFEGLSADPTHRPWIFSRSGWVGLQRYAWNWTGDIESSWESLKQTVPTILGLALSGHAFSGPDIGGFSGNPDAELYLRWFQMATFLPLYRTHSALNTKSREPWAFGDEVTNIIRSFIKLRYKLMPYLYSAIWETCQTGNPLIKPLFWDDPTDESLWDIGDEFYFGNNFLIAPVLEPSRLKRLVTFPKGTWFSFWDDQIYAGKTQTDVDLSTSTIPIFIRNGSIIPIEESGGLCLHVYVAGDVSSSTHIYWDSGDGYGDNRIDSYQLISNDNSIAITCDSRGNFPYPYEQVKIKIHGKALSSATINACNYPIIDNSVLAPPLMKAIFNV